MFRVHYRLEGALTWTAASLPQSFPQAAGLARALSEAPIRDVQIRPSGGAPQGGARLVDVVV